MKLERSEPPCQNCIFGKWTVFDIEVPSQTICNQEINRELYSFEVTTASQRLYTALPVSAHDGGTFHPICLHKVNVSSPQSVRKCRQVVRQSLSDNTLVYLVSILLASCNN